MTQDEIIEMARQSGIWDSYPDSWSLEKFAKLVEERTAAKEREFWMEQGKVDVEEAIRDEREACAKVCENESVPNNDEIHSDAQWAAKILAGKIRARGEA